MLHSLMSIRTFNLIMGLMALSCFFLLYLVLIPSKKPYVMITAVSDCLTYQVIRKKVATIPLKKAKVRPVDDKFDKMWNDDGYFLFTGLLQPAQNVIVHYRYADSKVSILIDGGHDSAGVLQFSDGSERKLSNHAMFVVDCSDTLLMKLPVAGPSEIGKELGVGDIDTKTGKSFIPFMSEGSVNVYARGRFGPYENNLYPVPGATFILPAGGRLSCGSTLTSQCPVDAEPWFGVAVVTSKGFKISATTLSSGLRLYRMGGSGESEKLALSLLTQAILDPLFQWFILILGVAQLILSIVNSLYIFGAKIIGYENKSTTFFFDLFRRNRVNR